MTDEFRVALSSDFRGADGSPTYPDFDLAPLRAAKGIDVAFLEAANPLRADQLEDFDALILLTHRFAAESVPKSGRFFEAARRRSSQDAALQECGIGPEMLRPGLRVVTEDDGPPACRTLKIAIVKGRKAVSAADRCCDEDHLVDVQH